MVGQATTTARQRRAVANNVDNVACPIRMAQRQRQHVESAANRRSSVEQIVGACGRRCHPATSTSSAARARSRMCGEKQHTTAQIERKQTEESAMRDAPVSVCRDGMRKQIAAIIVHSTGGKVCVCVWRLRPQRTVLETCWWLMVYLYTLDPPRMARECPHVMWLNICRVYVVFSFDGSVSILMNALEWASSIQLYVLIRVICHIYEWISNICHANGQQTSCTLHECDLV